MNAVSAALPLSVNTRLAMLLPLLLLLLVMRVLVSEALAVQLSTVLRLPAAVPPAAEPHAVPVVSLEPIILNYSRHLLTHSDLDESRLLSPFTDEDTAEGTSSSLTLVHSLHLLRPSTDSGPALTVYNVSFTQSAASPTSSAHPACASDVLQQHGLHLADCHVLPIELQSNERVSLLLSYRPTSTAVPSTYYVLVHSSEALYVSPLHMLLPPSVAAYQRADFVSPTVRSAASSTVGIVRSLLLSVPLLGFLGVSMLLFFAQTGQVHSTSVAALIHTLPVLPSMHAALAPYIYPLEAVAKGKSPAVHQSTAFAAPIAAPAAAYQPSPVHALLRRKPANSTASATMPHATSITPSLSSPTASSGIAPLRAKPAPDTATLDSAPSSPLAAPSLDLPNSALDLTQITFRHHKSLSVGTGEAMMKEVERELRRKRRMSKQPADNGTGQSQNRSESGGAVDGEPDIVSPPQTRRTMSVGSSGPLFFRFDRIVKELDERSSDGSRVGSESSSNSSTNTSNSDSDEERSKDKLSPEQPTQRTVAVIKPALSTTTSTSKPLDASAQPFTPRSALALATHGSFDGSELIQPTTAQSALPPARPAGPPLTSYTPRASFYSSQRASSSPRSMYSGGNHDSRSPATYQMYEARERAATQHLPPTTLFPSAPPVTTYPSYISPRHSTLPQRPPYSHSVSPRHSTFHPQQQHHHQQQQQQHLQPRSFSTAFRSSAPTTPPTYASPRNSNLSAASYSPPLSAFSDFKQSPQSQQQPQQPIIVYDHHTDTITYSPSASSPIRRPKLPHLILPKSPDSAPSLAPMSPQAMRTSVSPSHRFLYVGGAGTVRDSRWAANSDKESNDWPDTHPPPHRRQPTPFMVSMSPAVARSKEEALYEISEEDGEPQQPASIWSTVRSSSLAAANNGNSDAVYPYHSYPPRSLAPSTSSTSWSSPTSPSSHSYPLPNLSSSAASSPATSPLLTSGDAVADDEDLMDLRAMEETGKAGVVDGVRDVRDEDDVSGLADALGALGRARALHSIQLSLAQSRNAATYDTNADTDSGGKENEEQQRAENAMDALTGSEKVDSSTTRVHS